MGTVGFSDAPVGIISLKTHNLNTSVRASNLTLFVAVHEGYHHISLIVRDTVSSQL
jgi:hypothetical protein